MMRLLWLFLLLCFPSSTEEQEGNTSSSDAIFTPKPTSVSWRSVAFAVEGFATFAGNLLIVLAVATTKALRRKELMIITGLALSELIVGFGFFTAGIRRAWLQISGYLKQPSTLSHCMWAIPCPFYYVGLPFETFMLLIVSMDRLLAVKAPIWYWQQNNKYAYICVSLAGGFSAAFLMVAVIWSYFKPSSSMVDLICTNIVPMPIWLLTFVSALHGVGGWGSVFIYVFVLYFYRKHGKTLPTEQLKAEHMKRQRKMTKVIGICCLITLFTVCLLHVVRMILTSMQGTLVDHATFYTISGMIPLIGNINRAANIFVYSYHPREIRAAIVRILTFGQVKLSVEEPSEAQNHKPQRSVRVAPQELVPNEA